MGFKMVVKKVILRSRCGPGHGGGAGSARQRERSAGFRVVARVVTRWAAGRGGGGCGKRRWMLREEAVEAVGGQRERGPAAAPGAASPPVLVSVRPGRLSHRPGISS